MLDTVKRVLVIAAITTTGVVTSVATAHASAAPRLATAVGAVATTLPTTNLSGKGSALKWAPKSIKGAPTSSGCVAPGPYSFLILNKTKADQQIEYSGGPLGSPIPPKEGLYICGTGKLKSTFWPEADPNALLKVTIT
jgi:hypothetical protein